MKKNLRNRTHRENELQTAIVTSLQVWCERKNIECTSMEYYANQQGDDLAKICADFIATLNNSELLLAEVKVNYYGELQAFRESQFAEDLDLESHGIPIKYLYNNSSPIAYYEKPKPKDYAKMTLQGINFSSPSLLPGKKPDIPCHDNLLNWLDSVPPSGETASKFGEIFGLIRSEALISNGLLMLIYGTNRVSYLADLDTATMNKVINTLSHGRSGRFLGKKDQALLESFLDEEYAVFSRWNSPPKTPKPSSGSSGMSFC